MAISNINRFVDQNESCLSLWNVQEMANFFGLWGHTETTWTVEGGGGLTK